MDNSDERLLWLEVFAQKTSKLHIFLIITMNSMFALLRYYVTIPAI